jgi:hypothetical protein
MQVAAQLCVFMLVCGVCVCVCVQRRHHPNFCDPQDHTLLVIITVEQEQIPLRSTNLVFCAR